MRKLSRVLCLAVVAGGATTSPLFAGPAECYDKVIADCAAAMEDSNFLVDIAIGDVCALMLAGCAFD